MANNKNVDIKFSAHDALLEKPSSGTLKIDRLENQIIQSFGGNKTRLLTKSMVGLLKS